MNEVPFLRGLVQLTLNALDPLGEPEARLRELPAPKRTVRVHREVPVELRPNAARGHVGLDLPRESKRLLTKSEDLIRLRGRDDLLAAAGG
jgi:hypothetical protein